MNPEVLIKSASTDWSAVATIIVGILALLQGIIGTLLGYLWVNLTNRIARLEDKENATALSVERLKAQQENQSALMGEIREDMKGIIGKLDALIARTIRRESSHEPQ